jgi:hypothetical protein
VDRDLYLRGENTLTLRAAVITTAIIGASVAAARIFAGFPPGPLPPFERMLTAPADTLDAKLPPDRVLERERAALPRLRTRGQFFELETGERWTAIETSDFNLLARYLNGEDIRPVLAQRAEIGFNLLRVWTLMDLQQFGIGRLRLEEHPDLYQKLPAFLELCAERKLYVELTAYTGINDPNHWTALLSAVASSPNVIVELVNELDQNSDEPDHLGRVFDLNRFARPPPPILASHGSNGSQARPVQPFWDYATFHTNGAPEEQRRVGHDALQIWNGPTLTNETSRHPDSVRDRNKAFDAAAGAALLAAGSAFHSVHGKSSQLFEGIELELAKAWVAGARSVPLECQTGAFVQRQDLQGPSTLTVYQRGDDPRCLVTIRR